MEFIDPESDSSCSPSGPYSGSSIGSSCGTSPCCSSSAFCISTSSSFASGFDPLPDGESSKTSGAYDPGLSPDGKPPVTLAAGAVASGVSPDGKYPTAFASDGSHFLSPSSILNFSRKGMTN